MAVGLGIMALSFATVVAFFFAIFVMLLWNWLMPALFGLSTISYIQAWGLVLLSHLLFKGGHGFGRHHGGPRGFGKHKDFHQEFKDRMRRNCAHDAGPAEKGFTKGAESEK